MANLDLYLGMLLVAVAGEDPTLKETAKAFLPEAMRDMSVEDIERAHQAAQAHLRRPIPKIVAQQEAF